MLDEKHKLNTNLENFNLSWTLLKISVFSYLSMERQSWTYLKETFCKMFYKPEINVNPNDIEACHHLRNQDKKNSQGRKIASMY